MTFKKLLLATAVAAASSSALAMQAMDDESLSETTGQDGLTISIAPPAAGIGSDIVLHDSTGVVNPARPDSGAIFINDFRLLTPVATTIDLIIDATGDADNNGTSTDAMLNIAINLPASTTISTGSLHVADSNGAGAAIDSTSATLLNNMNIILGATTLNMQLGTENQGFMILTSTTIANGITLTNFALNDASAGGGSINATTVVINDFGVGANNLNVRVGVDATATALSITLSQLGTAGGGIDVLMTDVGLGVSGNTTDIGDVDLLGLNLNGAVITVTGH